MPLVINFLNSNFFIGLITLLAGSLAGYIYWRQKRDQKKDAANIILLEIKNAERALKTIKQNLSLNFLATDIIVMQADSWSKYKYLFVRDFDRDEWDMLTDFYGKCALLDEAIRYNNASFWSDVEQIRVNKQRILADFVKDYIKIKNTKKELADFNKITKLFDETYMKRQDTFGYSPQKPINDAMLYIDGMSMHVSQTSVGLKLKKISKIKP
jgi:hypothetical protein